MNDLISRQDAIDAVHYYIESGYKCDIFQELKDLPSAETKLKWIPVTERLPMNDSDVIVSILDESGDISYKYTSVGWYTPDGRYWIVDNEMCCGVIAWMPLPEPYKEVLANQRKRIKMTNADKSGMR